MAIHSKYSLSPYNHILAAGYEFIAGCEKGGDCSSGQYCNGKSIKCWACSFEECLDYARSDNADGFSYGQATSNRLCSFCTKNELSNLGAESNWGVYAKPGKCKFLTMNGKLRTFWFKMLVTVKNSALIPIYSL